MNRSKKYLDFLIGFPSLIATALLWRHSILLAIVLIAIGYVCIRRSSHRRAFIVYACVAFGGALSEVVMIHFGAWTYVLPDFAGIPLWLPFLWGNAGMFFISIAENIAKPTKRL